VNLKLKPRPVATGSRLRGNNQAGKLTNPKYSPPQAPLQAVHCGARTPPINAADAHRRLLLRGFMSAEPRRPRPADIEAMIAELPYGFWRAASGRIVIFNRRYRPLWQRLPDATIERADPSEWVSFVAQRWFDFTDARYEKTARERLRNILKDFFAGKDLTAHTIITEWDLDRPEVRS